MTTVGVIAVFVCLGASPAQPRIDDLKAPAADILRQLPGVVEVEVSSADNATHRIVHLRDRHFVPKALYAADLRANSDEPLTDEEIDKAYERLLVEVELVQLEQVAMLRHLIQHHGLRAVHVEGVTTQTKPIFEAKVSALRELGRKIAGLQVLNEPSIADDIEALDQEHRRDLIEIGAAGRLFGEIKLLPLEDEVAFATARPVDGVLDPVKTEAREDAQVKLLLDHGPFALVILGGAHDLSDNVPGRCEYIRVTTRQPKVPAQAESPPAEPSRREGLLTSAAEAPLGCDDHG